MIERILQLIEERGTTAYKLTTDLGLDSGSVSHWKKGKAKPSADAIIKIAEYFGVTTDYLLTGKESDTNEKKGNELTVEELARQEGITNEEYIKSLKFIFDLMKKDGYNTELASEFISKEYSKK